MVFVWCVFFLFGCLVFVVGGGCVCLIFCGVVVCFVLVFVCCFVCGFFCFIFLFFDSCL